MGWLIALGILALIAILPVGASVEYDADGFRAAVLAGILRIPVFPIKKKEKKNKDKKKEKKKTTAKQSKKKTGNKTEEKKKKGGSLLDFLPVLDRILDFLSAFRRKLRITQLELILILGGGDPCDLAINYGRGWAALGNLMPLLDSVFAIKKRKLEVECDFLADNTTVIVRMDISITIGRILSLPVVWGLPIVWEFLKIINKRKGGAKA